MATECSAGSHTVTTLFRQGERAASFSTWERFLAYPGVSCLLWGGQVPLPHCKISACGWRLSHNRLGLRGNRPTPDRQVQE